jgi:hypothetical protein
MFMRISCESFALIYRSNPENASDSHFRRSTPRVPAPSPGRKPRLLLEDAVEAGGDAEAALPGYILHRQIRCGQELLGPIHAKILQNLPGAFTQFGPEALFHGPAARGQGADKIRHVHRSVMVDP